MCTLPKHPMAPSRSSQLFCLHTRRPFLTWPLDDGRISPVLHRGFPTSQSPIQKAHLFYRCRCFPPGGEREEKGRVINSPYRAFPLPHSLFLGKRGCWNWLIQLFAQCLSQVLWDPEMFKGTSVERDPGVGSPKFHSPSHPQILGIRKPSLQSRSARH